MNNFLDLGIENKITLGVVIAATSIIVSLGAMDVHKDELQFEEQLTTKSLAITNRLGLSLQGPLWDLDDQQVSDIVTSEMKDPEIDTVIVHGDAPGAPPIVMKGRGDKWEIVDLTRQQDDLDYASTIQITRQNEFIGSVQVSLSDKIMKTKLKRSIQGIIIRTVLVNLALILLLLFLTRRLVTPLRIAESAVRASLNEKEILLKEIHHRVKNNLQVISGLLNLQAHHITDETGKDIFKDSQNRVITMALIHEELYQTRDLARVDFSKYIDVLARNLLGSYGVKEDQVRLETDVESVDLVVDTAIPCGLILNELISNSLKHAFPDGRKGTIRISFKTIGDDLYEITVADDGDGPPEGTNVLESSSLGLQLVTMLIEQLHGKLQVETVGGLTFRFSFKEYYEAGTELY
jgi:two-component sensor histidine kinase